MSDKAKKEAPKPLTAKDIKALVKAGIAAELAEIRKNVKYLSRRSKTAQDRYKILEKNHEKLLKRQEQFVKHIPKAFTHIFKQYAKLNISDKTLGKMAMNVIKYQMTDDDTQMPELKEHTEMKRPKIEDYRHKDSKLGRTYFEGALEKYCDCMEGADHDKGLIIEKQEQQIKELKALNREQFAAMDKYDDQLNAANKQIKELEEFAIWMTGCGYEFTQHDYFNKQRDKLLKH